MNTEPTSDIVTTHGPPQPLWAIQPTTEAVVTPWYEVFAANDPRGGPTSVGIAAMDRHGMMDSDEVESCLELQGPNGTILKHNSYLSLLEIGFPVLFRLNKPKTDYPLGYVLYGYSAATSVGS